MQGNQFVHTALVVALLGFPSAAFAQQQPNQWNRDGQVLQQSDRRDGDDRRDRDRANDGRAYGDRDNDDGRYGRDGRDLRSRRLNGEVASFGGFFMTLRNGRQVRLHQGTIIDPTGTTLRPGMRLAISGHANSDGTYEADRITVFDDRGR